MQNEISLCSNCNQELKGPFCHACGQNSRTMIKFFGEVLAELFDDIAGYDSRFRRTIIPLLFKPGQLTKDYISGKRFSYVAPFRLFLLTSVVLIILMKLNTGDLEISDTVKEEFSTNTLEEIDSELKRTDLSPDARDKLLNIKDQLATEKSKKQEPNEPSSQLQVSTEPHSLSEQPPAVVSDIKQTDSKLEVSSEDDTPAKHANDQPDYFEFDIEDDQKPKYRGQAFVDYPWLKSYVDTILIKQKAWRSDPKPLVHAIFELLPYMLLIIIPIFALFYKLLYVFKKRYFIEHLVFNIHTHCFLFLVIIVMIGLDYIAEYTARFSSSIHEPVEFLTTLISSAFSFWIVIYYVIAMKRIYRQGWVMTMTKSLFLSIIYLSLITFGLLITSLIGAWQA
jgi:hypothetical protein